MACCSPAAASAPAGRAAARDVLVGAVLLQDFPGGEELDGGAQGIADGQAEVGRRGALDEGAAVRGSASVDRRGAGDQLSGPKHLA